MIITIIFLSCLCVYLALHLFILKKSLFKLRKDFKEAKDNQDGEQHVQIAFPNKDLELLAVYLNEYINSYSEIKYNYEKTIKNIRNEITNLTHDLRTPITSMLGYIDFVGEESLTKEQKHSLSIVKRRAYDLNSLVEQLYEYVILENRDFNMNMVKVDLYKMLKEHLLSFYTEFEQKGIELVLDLPNIEQPIWAEGDPNYILRVLSNLTSNTIKYSEGEVLVSLINEHNQVRIIYKTLRSTLTDYDIIHMFDRFYKKDQARRTVRSSGLGLTIAKLYIEQMNGSMNAWGDDKYLYVSFIMLKKELLE